MEKEESISLISMKQLEQLDPSALDTIEFNIKSVKKYTSIFTIVLSLIIIVVSIIINLDSLSEIYAPRSQLPVTSVKYKQSDEKFTDQPICVTYLASEAVPAHMYIHYKIGDTNQYGNLSVPQDNSLDGFEYMRKYIGENGFQCFNLKGFSVKSTDQIRLACEFPSSVKVLIGSHTITSIQKEKQQEVLVVEGLRYVRAGVAIRLLLSMNTFILKDKLQVNYVPDVIHTLGNKVMKASLAEYGLPDGEIRIAFQDFYMFYPQSYAGTSYTIIRNNIADILGNVLAWRGLILIPIAIMLMLFPIVEKFYKFDLIKARLDSQVINNANFNIFSDIKRRLSSCCPNRFHEGRILDKAIDKIDEELDVVNILQLQTVMRRQRAEFNQIEREEDIFDCKIEEKDIKKDILLESSDANNNLVTHATISATKNEQIFSKNEQKHKSAIVSLIKSFIYTFDDTETSVSISTNQGKGYGSIWSLFSFILLTAAIVTMLLLLGVFNILPSTEISDATALDEPELTINISPYHVAVRMSHMYLTLSGKAYLVDRSDNIIQEVKLVNDQKCANLIASNNIEPTEWYCVSQSVVISSFEKNYAGLKLLPVYDDPTVPQNSKSLGFTEILIVPESLSDKNPAEYHRGYQGKKKNLYNLKKIVKNTDGERSEGYQLHQVKKLTSSLTHSMIQVSHLYKLAQEQSGSYWDIFNNTWGIVIIACDLLLFRVGRLINLKIISARVNTEKQEKRSDILTVLFDMDRLSKGVYKQELASVGFYYKHKLPIDSS